MNPKRPRARLAGVGREGWRDKAGSWGYAQLIVPPHGSHIGAGRYAATRALSHLGGDIDGTSLAYFDKLNKFEERPFLILLDLSRGAPKAVPDGSESRRVGNLEGSVRGTERPRLWPCHR